MVRTGMRAGELHSILVEAGWKPAESPAAPRLDGLPQDLAADVLALYRELGGVLERPRLAPGGWDLSFSGVLVELDESFHFNRYREASLQAPWAERLPWTAAYLGYCRRWERHAGTGGKRWSNESASRMFAGSDRDGVFDVQGASRWKQRALYDAIKDAAAAAGQVRLARVSIYDDVADARLDHVLYRKASVPAVSVADLVMSRIAAPTAQ